jgi:pimeloyl-ACP methyl ester carboxylesterase
VAQEVVAMSVHVRLVTAALGLTALVAAILTPVSSAAEGAIDWRPCPDIGYFNDADYECGRLEVPMDRDNPSGPSFSLAVARHRSTGTPEQRIGSLVFNPGGPGVPGLAHLSSAWAMLPLTVRDRFDLVTWDPRGTGDTTPAPADCPLPTTDPRIPLTGPVDWVPTAERYAAALAPAEAACQAANTAIVEHLGTNEAVADLERLRVAVGDPGLTYWGWSYGTRLGAAYAATYPDRIRAMVLDGPMDPGPWTTRTVAQGSVAPEQAFSVFARFYPRAERQFAEVLSVLERRTVRLTTDMTLDQYTAQQAVYRRAAEQRGYPSLSTDIGTMHTAVLGTGTARATARKETARWLARGFADMQASSEAWWVPSAISCLDTAARPTPADLAPTARRLSRTATDYAALMAVLATGTCAGYTFAPDPVPTLTAGAGPRVPLLVSGSRRDGATSGAWIPRMTAAFPAARSITYLGSQHVVYGTVGSTCVDAPITRYLLTGALPSADRTCANTFEVGGLID